MGVLGAENTDLVISGFGVQPYSARGLSQSLQPIDSAKNLRRTINGVLIDLAPTQFRKYASEISGSDQTSPALSGIWPGMEITVDCIAELSYKTGGTPQRTVVPGSSRVDGGFTFYRPRMTFIVMDLQQETDEWEAVVQWSMSLEEK